MSAQLSLTLSQSIAYSSASFVEHAGVRDVVSTVRLLASQRGFSLVYIMGAHGAGKTHLGVFLAGMLQAEQGRDVRLVHASDLAEWFTEELSEHPFVGGEVLILDDADAFLEQALGNGQSGIFVDVVERLANADGCLVLFGTARADRLVCSPQAKSRIESGLHMILGNPEDGDLDGLLDRITKQRGLLLKESKRSYILRRVPRTLPALVECVERLEEGSDFSSASTSYQNLSGAVRF